MRIAGVLTALTLAASFDAPAARSVAGHYRAVTETEYAIDLRLAADGRAAYDLTTWEADAPDKARHDSLEGTWKQRGSSVTIDLANGSFVSYRADPCLSYQEFAQTGCSPGLAPAAANTDPHLGLQRFSLWEATHLRLPR